MEFKNVLSVFALLLVIGLFSSATTSAARVIGGYRPITDPTDSYVVEIAKFAVSEHNKKASSNLVFVKVVSGEKQVVDGTNYKLNIAAKTAGHGGDGDVYEAIVYDKPSEKSRSLTSFKTVN